MLKRNFSKKSDSRSRSRSESIKIKRKKDFSRSRSRESNETRKKDSRLSVLHNLPYNIKEQEIFGFFKKQCGKILDIKILKDKEGKPKGMAMVEFENRESVLKAIDEFSGKQLNENIIRVEKYDIEKYEKKRDNRNARGKYYKNEKEKNNTQLSKIYVGGLIDHLNELSEKDLKKLFSSFGDIEFVDLQKDSITGKNKGYGFIQYTKPEYAKEAIEKMNGFAIGNRNLKVSSVQSNLAGTLNSVHNFINSDKLDLDDESGHNFLHNSQSRALLMQKLTRETPVNSYLNNTHLINSQLIGVSFKTIDPLIKDEISSIPTSCLLLTNLFTKEEILGNNSNYLSDLKDEVEDECKNFGEVKKVFIDPASNGYTWVKFHNTQSALNAQKSLNERYFAGKKISVCFIKEEYFKKKFAI